MKRFSIMRNGIIITLAFLTALSSGEAGSLTVAGVLANSGEQGEALARFGDGKRVGGIGVVYTPDGSLWTGGSDGELIRYSVDGRKLASYRTPAFGSQHGRIRVIRCGDDLLLKLGNKLYALPLDSSPDEVPIPLNIEVSRLSFGAHAGWAAASHENRVFWVNAKGETREVGELPLKVEDLEVGPEGHIYLRTEGDMMRQRALARMDQPDVWKQTPGARPQWLNGFWFGHDWHGTIRRSNAALEPDPGVVLGGNSGSFIGYLPGNYELFEGTGMAWLRENLYAVAGTSGILHLLVWEPKDNRFEIVRRIGPLQDCGAVVLDGTGRIWVGGGVLQWGDDPAAPLQHGIRVGTEGPAQGVVGPFAAARLPNDAFVVLVAPAKGPGAVCTGTMDGPAQRFDSDLIRKEHVAGAIVQWNKKSALLVVDAEGKGVAIYLSGGSGKPEGKAGEVALKASSPIQNLTSLTSDGQNRLWAGVEGEVVEFAREDKDWREVRRWKQWEGLPDGVMGKELHLSYSQGRLWVSDSDRHRVLIVDAESGKSLGSVGVTDQVGNDLASLSAPRALSANGDRAVVFDSGNQRLVKLQWKE